MSDCAFDEMVQVLYSERLGAPAHDIFGLRRVVYSTQEGLASLLNPEASSNSPKCSTPTLDEPSGTLPGAFTAEEDSHEKEPEVDTMDEDAEFAKAAAENQKHIARTDIPQDMYAGHSKQEVDAVLVMQRLCKRVLTRKRAMEEPGQAARTRRYFALLKATIQPATTKEEFGYNVRCLGPLPHLLASLDGLHALLLKRKAELKKGLLSDVSHKDLDQVGAKLTRVK